MTDRDRARAALEALPGLENLIMPYGHESGLLANHPPPCVGHDFCLMRHAQRCADTIRAALEAMAQDTKADEATGSPPTAPGPESGGSGASLPRAQELRDWADDADQHGNKYVPVSPSTLRKVAAALEAMAQDNGQPSGQLADEASMLRAEASGPVGLPAPAPREAYAQANHLGGPEGKGGE